jgi:hypothetical protein
VRWQIVQHGWATALDTPKTDDSEATVAIDAGSLDVLRAHRGRQRRERLAAGPQWTHTGLVFTSNIGAALHPADVTDHFHHLAGQAGLASVRLHDLRHGHATMALAAGVQMKVISGQLRHSSTTTTDKFLRPHPARPRPRRRRSHRGQRPPPRPDRPATLGVATRHNTGTACPSSLDSSGARSPQTMSRAFAEQCVRRFDPGPARPGWRQSRPSGA